MRNARYSGGRAPQFRKLSPAAETRLQAQLQAIIAAGYSRGRLDAEQGKPMAEKSWCYQEGWEAAKRPA